MHSDFENLIAIKENEVDWYCNHINKRSVSNINSRIILELVGGKIRDT